MPSRLFTPPTDKVYYRMPDNMRSQLMSTQSQTNKSIALEKTSVGTSRDRKLKDFHVKKVQTHVKTPSS
jgi:hypothetical protein